MTEGEKKNQVRSISALIDAMDLNRELLNELNHSEESLQEALTYIGMATSALLRMRTEMLIECGAIEVIDLYDPMCPDRKRAEFMIVDELANTSQVKT